MVKFLLLTFIAILSISGISQQSTTYISIGNGDWMNSGTWDINQVPSSDQTTGSDSIIITHTVILNGDLDIKTGTVIIIEGCDTLHVTGNVIFNNGSTLIVDSCAVLIIDGNVTNNNNSTNINVNGTILIGGDYVGGNGSDLSGTGNIDISGSITLDGTATVFNDSALPVELFTFNCYNENGVNILSWVTLSEINSDYYIIENSTDCYKWEIIGYMKAAGTYNYGSVYDFYDKEYSDTINYYKVTQFDFNGDSESFDIAVMDNSVEPKIIIKTVNFMGQEVNKYYRGMVIEIYNNNSVRKFFRD